MWFPSDPHQVTWDVYLDEIARVGYVHTELGPQGFMPQDPQQLQDELAPPVVAIGARRIRRSSSV